MNKGETIKVLVDAGIERVVLGTKAVSDSVFLNKALKEFKDKVIVSIDGKDGKIATEGWRSSHKSIDVLTFASFLKDLGVEEIIYTDTLKDGTLSGPLRQGGKNSKLFAKKSQR